MKDGDQAMIRPVADHNRKATPRAPLLFAFAGMILPILIVLAYLFLTGYSDRTWVTNTYYLSFALWIPTMIGLSWLATASFWDRHGTPHVSRETREALSTAVSMSLIFAVFSLTEEMTRSQAIASYAKSAALFIALYLGATFAGRWVLARWRSWTKH